ncbi:MAG: hypothetical protein AAF609_22175, partial [Cyanobacteria bacterium P01_C01_bin.120]
MGRSLVGKSLCHHTGQALRYPSSVTLSRGKEVTGLQPLNKWAVKLIHVVGEYFKSGSQLRIGKQLALDYSTSGLFQLASAVAQGV